MNDNTSQKAQTYYFKKEQKKELLNGRTIAFVAKKIGVSYVHLTNILNGKTKCSQVVANSIWYSADAFRPFEYYFRKGEE